MIIDHLEKVQARKVSFVMLGDQTDIYLDILHFCPQWKQNALQNRSLLLLFYCHHTSVT